MRRVRRNSLLCLSTTLFLGGCVGTDVGNPPDDRRTVATLSLRTYDAEAEAAVEPGALRFSDGSDVEQAWLVVESATLVGCDRMSEQTVNGPFVVELVSGAIHPQPIVFEVPEQRFCHVRVQPGVAKTLPEPAPPQLVGKTLFVAGHSADDVRYTMTSEVPRTLSWHGEGLMLDGPDNRFVTTFVPTRWLEDIDPHPQASHEVPVDLSRDPAAASRFLANLLQSSRVVKDIDRDNRISRDEYSHPAARPAP